MNILTEPQKVKHYVKVPKDAFKVDLNNNVRMVYGFLFTRLQLSIKNNWIDESGKPFVRYSIKRLAEDCHISENTVKTALKELEEKKLIKRIRTGAHASKIYLGSLPYDSQNLAIDSCQKLAIEQLPKIGYQDSHNLDTNKIINKRTMNNKQKNRFHNFDQREYSEEVIEQLYEM